MSLALRRRSGESIYLHLKPGSDVEQLLKVLATKGIEIRLGEIRDSKAIISIDAPESISILREELLWE
ncbi:carbon storage regulator [Pseudomonas sp. OTU750018]|uniref:carbon storage regulator n=1 Tax=Pseudomonas sp. OTU750018 TaxID=2709708 RepID=UPI0014247598|nr:carbon storage regulator [Pseudomonas sp. OTU750018]